MKPAPHPLTVTCIEDRLRVETIASALRRLGAEDEADDLCRLSDSGKLLWALTSTNYLSLYLMARAVLTAGVAAATESRPHTEYACALRVLEQLGDRADQAALELEERAELAALEIAEREALRPPPVPKLTLHIGGLSQQRTVVASEDGRHVAAFAPSRGQRSDTVPAPASNKGAA